MHRAWTNIFFPTPAGPVSSRARIRGPLFMDTLRAYGDQKRSSECSILFLCSHRQSLTSYTFIIINITDIILHKYCIPDNHLLHQWNKSNCCKKSSQVYCEIICDIILLLQRRKIPFDSSCLNSNTRHPISNLYLKTGRNYQRTLYSLIRKSDVSKGCLLWLPVLSNRRTIV